MAYAPTTIDLSRVALPDIIEALDFEALHDAFIARFIDVWEAERLVNPALPAYDVSMLESDPVVVVGQAWSYLRLLDRARVNDAIRALLAPFATGADLEAVVARQNISRRTVVPANEDTGTAAVMESDAALLRRYLLSFDGRSAGSRDRYLYEAWTAWPQAEDGSGMLDARVNGHAVHGRPGDVDIVIIGAGGDIAPADMKAAVRAAVSAPNVVPEATGITVLDATRREYAVDLVIEIPSGPDAALIRQETIDRIRKAGEARMVIGGEVPEGYLAGAAYGGNVVKVRDLAPVVIEPDPYTVPVLTVINVTVEVRS